MSKSQQGSGDQRWHRPKIGISTCLLGEQVRYDGGHKLDRFLTNTFGQFVEWVPVCPEVECGLPIPRESMRLEGDPEHPRLVTSRTRRDLTERMVNWARKRLKELEKEDLCGFVFKSKSPSSGMERVKVFDKHGMPHKVGSGIFAGAFMKRFPLIPVEEDGRLHDPELRENFIERIFCLDRYRNMLRSDATVKGLSDFHAKHKMLLMAHDSDITRKMGALVGQARGRQRDRLFAEYEAMMIKALSRKATRRKNANVLMHMMGYLKKHLTADEKQEMLAIISQYKEELIPLIVPVTLMSHYVRKHDEPYLKLQYYLNPHPIELKLRNHA